MVNGLIGTMLNVAAAPGMARRQAEIDRENMKRQFEYNKELMGIQFDQSKEMAEFQNDINVENWERENAYNDPLQQKKRLENAGYHTGALEGSLSGASSSVASNSGAITGSIPGMHFDTSSAQTNALANVVSAGAQVFDNYVQSKLAESTLLNDEVKRQLQQEQAKTEAAQRALWGEQGNLYAAQTSEILKMTPLRVQQLDAITKNTQQEFELLCENILGVRANRRLTEKNVEKIPFEINSLIAQEKAFIAQSVKSYSDVAVNKALEALHWNEADVAEAQAALNVLYGEAQAFENWFNDQTKGEQLSIHTYKVLQERNKNHILSTDSQYRSQLHDNTLSMGKAMRFSLYGNTAVNMFNGIVDAIWKATGGPNKVDDNDKISVGSGIIDGAKAKVLMRMAESGFAESLSGFATSGLIY